MDFNEHSKPDNLEKYSFLWSEARLIIAAAALFLGGVPPIFLLATGPAVLGIASLLLKLSWIISGFAAGYLAYRWYESGQMLFGKKDTKDTAAFLVSVVSGFNLGITGLIGKNIGMSISSNHLVFDLVALLYLASAVYLFWRWNAAGKRLFGASPVGY